MHTMYQPQARSLNVGISNEVDSAMAEDVRNLLAKTDVAAIRIDVSEVTHLSLDGLRLLAELKEFATLSGTSFKLVGRKRAAIRQAFEHALEMASIYQTCPQPSQ